MSENIVRQNVSALPNLLESPRNLPPTRNSRNQRLPKLNQVVPYEEKEAIITNYQDIHNNQFILQWRNLSFTAKEPFTFGDFNRNTKVILQDLNGWFKSGQLTAIMGPSGAGKSTLLGCISGLKQNGMNGEVKISGINEAVIGFVPQFDHLLANLTVRETLLFAAKLKYGTKNDNDAIVDKMIGQFNLNICANNYVQKCSGGQKKRLSMALEIVSKPNILILDEPTTGLDAPSCAHMVHLLLEMTKSSKKCFIFIFQNVIKFTNTIK